MTEYKRYNMEHVCELRQRTGHAMLMCRKALDLSGGDKEKAFQMLRDCDPKLMFGHKIDYYGIEHKDYR